MNERLQKMHTKHIAAAKILVGWVGWTVIFSGCQAVSWASGVYLAVFTGIP